MNEKQAKKLRKETRLYWKKYIARFASLPLWERVKMAYAIVTLRSNTARTRLIVGGGTLPAISNNRKGSAPANSG